MHPTQALIERGFIPPLTPARPRAMSLADESESAPESSGVTTTASRVGYTLLGAAIGAVTMVAITRNRAATRVAELNRWAASAEREAREYEASGMDDYAEENDREARLLRAEARELTTFFKKGL